MYVLGLDGLLIVCNPLGLGFDVGGACLPSGFIVPVDDGTGTIEIRDALLNPTSAFYCQDGNADAMCDGASVPFCDSIVLTSGQDWNPGVEVLVLIAGPLFGNPLLSPCGALSLGTTGLVVSE